MSRTHQPVAGGTASGLTVRTRVNAVLAALESSFSGAGDDSGAVVGQVWHNTTTDTLRAKLTAGTKTLAMVESPTFSGTLTSGGLLVAAAGLDEKKISLSASAIDCSTGNVFSKTISATTTFTVSNVPTTGTAFAMILDLTNGGAYTITWWSGVKWAAGTAPTLTASGRDVLGFITHDGGTTWSGFVLGKAMA